MKRARTFSHTKGKPMETRPNVMGVMSWIVIVTVGVLSYGLVDPASAQVILYVDDSVSASGDGLNWSSAMNDVQPALTAAAVPGSGVTEIRVGQGTYVPSQREDPDDPRSVAFRLVDGVTLRGGYAGIGASDPNDYDPGLHATILTGDLNGDYGAYHVTMAHGITAFLHGFTTTRGQAYVNPGTGSSLVLAGGGMLATASNVTISDCRFVDNSAKFGGAIYQTDSGYLIIANSFFENNGSGIYLSRGGAIHQSASSGLQIENCSFQYNQAHIGAALSCDSVVSVLIDHSQFYDGDAYAEGGATWCKNSPTSITNCSFARNRAPLGTGGAIVASASSNSHGSITIDGCTFQENFADGSGGAIKSTDCSTTISNCSFAGDHAGLGGGAVLFSGVGLSLRIESCRFVGHDCGLYWGGAVLVGSGGSAVVLNTEIASSSAGHAGGGIFSASPLSMINCTVVNNTGTGIALADEEAVLTATNCIFWGNSPEQVLVLDGGPPPPPPSGIAGASSGVTYSCIQGGWAGSNNISLDPLFIQPGCRNLRLADNSPCLDAGSNAAIPKGLTLDLDGQPRIQNGTVAMGAYESPHEMLPLAACGYDIDPGESSWMVPAGGVNEPLDHSAARITNTQGPADAYAITELFDEDLHPSAGGYSELGEILRLETSISPGLYASRVFISFGPAELAGRDPLELDVTHFDAQSGNWTLAVAGNLGNSPGHAGPVGDRFAVIDTGEPYTISFDLGDYGVVWNPSLQRGYVFTNVDHAGEFALGAALLECAADCAQPFNGQVDAADLFAVVDSWGAAEPGSLTDINHDSVVDVDDLLMVITAWGSCPE